MLGRARVVVNTAAVALPAAALLFTLAGTGARPASRHAPPATPPAALDATFLADLDVLTARLPLAADIAVLPPPTTRERATWYWTMAAFTVPSHTWTLMRDSTSRERWMLAQHNAASPGAWAEVVCASEWCLWTR